MPKISKSIPVGWREVALGDVAEVIKGITYKSEDYGTQENGLPFITLKCISKGGGFSTRGLKYYKGKFDELQVVEPGDLLIANTDLTRAGDVIGAPIVVPDAVPRALISMDLSLVKVNSSLIDRGYLYNYLMQDFIRKYMRSIASGTTVLHLRVSTLPSLKIMLPTLEEQKYIAGILSDVDQEIKINDQISLETQKLKRGLMHDLFNGVTRLNKYEHAR